MTRCSEYCVGTAYASDVIPQVWILLREYEGFQLFTASLVERRQLLVMERVKNFPIYLTTSKRKSVVNHIFLHESLEDHT